jgi:hypothetical protein
MEYHKPRSEELIRKHCNSSQMAQANIKPHEMYLETHGGELEAENLKGLKDPKFEDRWCTQRLITP